MPSDVGIFSSPFKSTWTGSTVLPSSSSSGRIGYDLNSILSISGGSFHNTAAMVDFPEEKKNSRPVTSSDAVPFADLDLESLLTSRRTYLCPLCPKECVDRSTFKKHYTCHSGEKPFGCPICSYRTNIVSNLYKHAQIQHNVNMKRLGGS